MLALKTKPEQDSDELEEKLLSYLQNPEHQEPSKEMGVSEINRHPMGQLYLFISKINLYKEFTKLELPDRAFIRITMDPY